MPSESGVTSSNRRFWKPPERISAWIAAPSATGFVGVLRRIKLRPGRAMVLRAEAQGPARLFKFGAAEKIGYELTDQRHAGLAADQDDLVQVYCFKFRIGERPQAMRTVRAMMSRVIFSSSARVNL